MKKTGLKIIYVMLAAFMAVSCSPTDKQMQDDSKISVVSAIFPSYDFARNVCADTAEVSMLISPGSDIHSFEPTAKDINRIINCDLFIYTGGESDEWVENILSSMNKEINTLKMMDVSGLEKEDYTHFQSSENHAHHHGEYDEHVWTSPENAIKIVNAIKEKMCVIDAENSAVYTDNAQNYIKKIDAVKTETKDVIAAAKRKTIVMGDRFPLLYYAKYYGLEVFAAFPGCAEKTEPSAATVAFLADKIKEENISVVFKSELSGGQTADALCRETGAKCLELAACHNISKEDFDADIGYVDIMRKNAQALTEALN